MPLTVDDQVELFQFDAFIFSGKSPIDADLLRISLGLPSQYFAFQKSPEWGITVYTLSAQNAEVDVHHIEPTIVFGY